MYACKIVYEQYIKTQVGQQRNSNLEKEIDILSKADKKTSVSLVELIKEKERSVLIQDFANGVSLSRLLGARGGPLREEEAQKIMKKLVKGLNTIYQLKIIHRDLNINNVVLHIPMLEPSLDDLKDTRKYLDNLYAKRQEHFRDLTKTKFEVRIVDYGLSSILEHGCLADTPNGTPCVLAPEVLDPSQGYDQRVDVWGLGIILYMLLTAKKIFNDEV